MVTNGIWIDVFFIPDTSRIICGTVTFSYQQEEDLDGATFHHQKPLLV